MARKILIVEDNENNRILLRDVLVFNGYTVLEACDGAAGVKMAREQRPDIILMDLHMPVMDGFTALRVLKEDPATKDLGIIAVTSLAMRGDKEKIIEAGFDDYIAKPVDTRQLPVTVENNLTRRENP